MGSVGLSADKVLFKVSTTSTGRDIQGLLDQAIGQHKCSTFSLCQTSKRCFCPTFFFSAPASACFGLVCGSKKSRLATSGPVCIHFSKEVYAFRGAFES